MTDNSDKITNISLSRRLLEFGLNSHETRIYLYLLNKLPKTINEIARDLDIPRTSVYDNSEKLIAKGMLARVVNYKSHQLKALPIKILQNQIDESRSKIDSMEKNLAYLKKYLSGSFTSSLNTEINYYHGKQGFMQMNWNTLSAKQEIIRYPEFGRIEIVGEKFFKSWAGQIMDKRITERAIVNPKPETLRHFLKTDEYEKRSLYQETRMLPEDTLYVSGDTTIYNDTFAVCFWKQGEIVGIEIENPELVKMQISIFETLWKLSKPVPLNL